MDSEGATVILPLYRDAKQPVLHREMWMEPHFTVSSGTYAKAVQWYRNVFKLPSGKARKVFVAELGQCFHAYAEESSFELIVCNDNAIIIAAEDSSDIKS